jgi:GT2 family glycosyltransferase
MTDGRDGMMLSVQRFLKSFRRNARRGTKSSSEAPCASQSTTREDLRNCYRLFLQRENEDEAVVAPRPHRSLIESVCDFLGSPEFADKIAFPSADGRLPKLTVSDAVREWSIKTLLLPGDSRSSAATLIALALQQREIATALEARKPFWLVREAIRGLLAVDKALGHWESLEQRLGEVSRNLDVVGANGIALQEGGPFIDVISDDAGIIIEPTGTAVEGDLMAVRLRCTIKGTARIGRLYLDYGGGFTEENSLTLRPDLAGLHHAIIAAPRRIKAMRWKPVADKGIASISVMEAVKLSPEEYIGREMGQNDKQTAESLLLRIALETTRRPEGMAGVALSRILSPSIDAAYARWMIRNEPHKSEADALFRSRDEKLVRRPQISVVTPVYNTPPDALIEMIDSVRRQAYSNWQLCIADDASTSPHVKTILERVADEDPRIKVVYRTVKGGVCHASNSAFDLATGEWVAMLDHDGVLAAQALLSIAEYIEANPTSGLIYSDEDKLDECGQRFDPYFKPVFSPELLLAQNYMSNLTAIRIDLVKEVGGWRIGYEGCQDHDLVLRVIEQLTLPQVLHIPRILYHRRASAEPVEKNAQKDRALPKGQTAISDHLQRIGKPGRVEALRDVPHYRVRYDLPTPLPLVSLIVPTRDKVDVLKLALESILDRTTYRNYEILIVDNGSVEQDTLDYLNAVEADQRVHIIRYPYPFNYSKINNFAIKQANGSIIGLINNDIEVIAPDWLEEMVSWAIQEEIGCVGAKLYYPDMTIQHAGVIVGLHGCAGHSHKFFPYEAAGYFDRLKVHQNLSAVTAACLLVRRSVFEEVGGLDEELAVAFNDVDFCLRVREAGYRNLFTPFAELFHHESASRGDEDTLEKMARAATEIRFMKERWKETLTVDPFYSPHLPYDREDFGLTISVGR